jgi:hypothetical protein
LDLEEYLKYCEKHPVYEKSEGEEDGEKPSKKLKKNEGDDNDEDEGEIITSKDIKNKK